MNIEALIRLIEIYAEATGLTYATVSTYCSGAGDFYARLKRGCDVTTRRAARVTQWFSDNWPADLVWPSDIPRPEPSPGSPASKDAA